MNLEPGTVLADRYRITRHLRIEGAGSVYAADCLHMGGSVAIKVPYRGNADLKDLDDDALAARLVREVRVTALLSGDHWLPPRDLLDTEDGPAVVVELREGETLLDRLKRTGPLPFGALHPLVEQAWDGLCDLHAIGVVHRNLKPSTVLLEPRHRRAERVTILDLSLCKAPEALGGDFTEMGQSVGTFSYMPPEQIGRSLTVDARADIYTLATLIFQTLSGQLPFAARNILVMVDMKTKTAARRLGEAMPAAVDPALETFLARGLARDPAERFESAAAALEAWRGLGPG